MVIYFWIAAVVVFIFLVGIRIVRPTHRGLIERLGRYNRFATWRLGMGKRILPAIPMRRALPM